MSEIHLKDLSKVYLDNIAEKKKDDSYLETDMKKRQANNEKARKDMEKVPGQKNPHFEEKQLDPVGQEDADIDNDGDTDKSDKYLHKRRKAIRKAMKKRMSESVNLIEVEDKVDDEEKPVKEKKCNNKVSIMPKISEAVEDLGGVVLEEIEIVDILEEISDDELIFLNDSLIEEIVLEVFEEAVEEGYDVELLQQNITEGIDISLDLLTERVDPKETQRRRDQAKDRLATSRSMKSAADKSASSVRSDKLSKVRSAVSKVGSALKSGAKAAYKGANRAAGYAAGTASRAVSSAKSEFKKGYERGSKGSSPSSSSDSESSSSEGSSRVTHGRGGKKKPGMLKRIGSALKKGLKKAVGKSARVVSKAGDVVARRMGEEVENTVDFNFHHKYTVGEGLQKVEEGKKKGLWDNIHAKRKRGEKPAKPGDKDYPKTLNVEGIEKARDNVGASKCWKGKKLGTPKTKMKGGKEVPNCVDA